MGPERCWTDDVDSFRPFSNVTADFPTLSPGPITCFESQAEFDEFWNNTLVDMPFQVRGNFSDQTDLDFFYSQVDPFESQLDGLGKKCMESETGQFLQYVGTAATVRDLISLSDYLEGPDCGVHYWVILSPFVQLDANSGIFQGFSYGTTIGQWLINSEFSNCITF